MLFSASVATSFGQASNPSPYVELGQMLNLSNTYANKTNDTAFGATLYLTSASRSSTTGLGVAKPVIGYGPISFTVCALKGAVVNPTVTVTPQRSYDNVHWHNIPGVTVATLTPTSTTTEATTAFDFSTNYGNYYRVKLTTTDTVGLRAFYNFTKLTQITLSK